MPIGPFGEIIGTTGTLQGLADGVQKYKSKVVAPRNPKLVKGEQTEFKIKPSQYMFQMSMNTEQKLANQHTMKVPVKTKLLDMSETSHQKVCAVSVDEPMFQPFPSEVFFQNFEPFETYEVPLTLRNNDKVPRLVKVSQDDSPYFKIISPHNVGHKVGPGLPTTFKIQFTPEEKRDYQHEILCVTEREKFIVPIRAIGSRAILDFPDDVNFSLSPVKHSSTKTLLVRNIGNREAKFTLEAEQPFHITPMNGVLAVNESMQITVEFKPVTVGDHQSDLVIRYDTGEDIYMSMYGAAQDFNVRLDKNSIRVENTYISMANQRTVTISNRSDVIVHYKWSQFATQEEEDQQKLLFCDSLNNEQTAEHDRFLEECITDPSLRDKMSILSRTFQNRRKLVHSDAMVFNDDVFKFDPVEGDIWPNSNAEVTVVFKPTEADLYTCTAFCDVTGRESRLPLRIQGVGVGPKVQFSFDKLDMGNIFVNSTHTYEVVLANKGDIDAIFNIVPSSSLFGQRFSFNPSEGIVMPDGHQAIQVTFNSTILGDFDEVFDFQIDGSPEHLKLNLRGCVIGPTFHFDVPKLKFGNVSYGFTSTQTCTLTNTALVPMSFNMRVLGDGSIDSISSLSDYDSFNSDNSSNQSPKEFSISPANGSIPPQSEIKVAVNLTSNTIKKYDMSLVVDVAGVGEEVVSLPISARCIVPNITVLTPILDYGRCFLCHPYEHNVKLHNDTDLPAKYELVPQHVDDMTPILFTSPKPRGIVEPHGVLDVPVVITPQGLEELEIVSQMIIFGSPDPPLSTILTCIGEGPVVHIMPLDLDWKEVNVLTDNSKIIRLSNESLIPARFVAEMVRPNSVWSVEPSSGEIPAEDQLELTVTACLDDAIRFHDKVQISIQNGSTRTVPVTAFGIGATIVTDPPMLPSLNLGPHFSKGPLVRNFTLTNRGRRHQSLVWGSEGFSFVQKPKRGGLLKPLNPKDMKYRDAPPEPEPPKPVFTLMPQRMELAPGESCEVQLEGCVDTPQVVKERLMCHAIIGKSGGKELIMRVGLNCEFITPLLEFSSDLINFRMDKGPGDELETQVKELQVTNVSSLPLTTQMSLPHPFAMIQDGETCTDMEMRLGIGESVTLLIQFDAAFRDDSHSRISEEVLRIAYKEHPHVDEVKIRGEVYFPNLLFEKTEVNFGCILNDTEVTRYVNITNHSPQEVKYKWSFLVEEGVQVTTFHTRPTPPPIQEMDIEDLENEEAEELPVDQSMEEERPCGEGETDEQLEEEALPEHQIIIEGAESPRTDPAKEEDVQKEQLIQQEEQLGGGEEKTDPEKPVPADGEVTTDDGTQIQSLHIGDQQLEEEQEEEEHIITDSRPVSQLGMTPRQPVINPVLAQLIEEDKKHLQPLDVTEVFDILPLYGTLKPGDTEQITFTFFGHQDTTSVAKAICEVEGGPAYEITLKGEASLVEYRFDCLDIDYGKQMYDQAASAEIVLINTGMVGFEFTALGMDPAMAAKPKPGIPVMIPHTGFIEANSQQVLTVKLLSGVPERFEKNFKIQVAHFEPDEVTLYGEGVFPRISLDLPRAQDVEGQYERLLTQAKERIQQEQRENERPSSAVSGKGMDAQPEDDVHLENEPSELEIQMEAERLVVAEFAVAEQEREVARPDILLVHSDSPSRDSRKAKAKKKPTKPKARLPTYLLDFGHVVLGTVRTHVVRATNTGWFPVSFAVDRENLYQHGFNVELDRIRQLPGAPDHETVDFVVSFDPRGANLGLGEVDAFIPINIIGGPQVVIEAKANVTMPDMQISSDVLEFQEVNCGECKVITVQLHNHQHVRCEWNATPTEREKKKGDRHVPMHLRRKTRPEKPKAPTFEMMPQDGYLLPGQRVNVQVKFMPTEHKFYEQRISIRLAQSSQRITMLCRGQGLEPHVEFERNMVEFGPILPHSPGDEQDILLKNPCPFPIEIYNLEFDKSYLEEEKILRLMKGYDDYSTLLLPPREPGTKLPPELTDYYEEQMKKLEEEERIRREEQEAAEQRLREQQEHAEESALNETETTDNAVTMLVPSSRGPSTDPEKLSTSIEQGTGADTGRASDDKKSDPLDEDKMKEARVGDNDITPVSAAIARHLGIDLSPEGKAARNRRGIVCIVHGAPVSGKTSTAVALAKRYEAALLLIDGIVTEAISNGNTPAGLKARELCAEAARRRAEELRLQEEEAAGGAVAEPAPTGKKGAGLSVEAVTAHTQGSGQVAVAQSVAHSMVSNKKTSTISDQKSKGHHGSQITTGKAGAASSNDTSQYSQSRRPSAMFRAAAPAAAVRFTQKVSKYINSIVKNFVPGSPPPLAAPIARRLSISASVAGEDGLMSTVLPEDVLVDILSERLLLNDCQRGIVFDGLETLFSQNMKTTCLALLKAINNRKYIYFVTLKLDYNVMKEQEKKAQEEKERAEREREEEERRHLEEMSEDEYDAMSEEAKAEVDKKRLEIKKERLCREMEEKRLERERREREAAEAELRRIEEEKASKRKRKGVVDDKNKDGKKGQAPGQAKDSKSKESVTAQQPKSQEGGKKHAESEHTMGKTASNIDRPDSHTRDSDRAGSAVDLDTKKKKEKSSKEGKRPVSNEKLAKGSDGPSDLQDEGKEQMKESEILLLQRFRTFEHATKEINEIVDSWERQTGMLRPMTPLAGAEQEEAQHPPSGKKPKKGGDKKADAKSRAEQMKEQEAQKAQQAAEAEGEDGESAPSQTEEERREKRLEDGIGLPHILVDCGVDKQPTKTVLDSTKLPTVEEVLDGLGLGPRGPPIPPPANFGVVPFPVKRHTPPGAETGHYVFVASSPDDPNLYVEEKPLEPEVDEEKSITPDQREKEHTTPTGKGKKDKLDKKDKSGRKSSAKKAGRRSSMVITPPPSSQTPASETDNRLGTFRWVIPANSEITLRLRFISEDLGQFDQTLNFEIMGTRRRYQLYCRGICAFPNISREPRIVFPHRKKTKKADEIVHKKYILAAETYEFGPLLVGKSRDKYKEGKYPENMEKLTISNTSPLEADISFCFKTDSKAETFLLDPPNMLLKPGQQEELTIWAYPKTPKAYEDALVCCIKENPEPVVFKLICHGVRPELEPDKKQLHFDKVLLHRKDTKSLYLRNPTLLPVLWRLSGLESLGDDFSVSQESGIIEPLQEFPLHAYFRAMKPVTTNRKSIRLEVYDVDNIMGLVQSENIQVHAEAYDVALDMSFPRGADGGIDFDVIRVSDEQKQQCSLKNKGKYEVAYSFVFEPTDECPEDVCKMFTVTPQKGTLSPVDRPAQVQVSFRSTREVSVKDQPILKCQVIEPNIMEGGEVIAMIPIKITARSVFSKYNILPVSDINFGAMLINSTKKRTFTLENKGDKFEFKYNITKMVKAELTNSMPVGRGRGLPGPAGKDKRTRSRDGSSSGRSVRHPHPAPRYADSLRQDLPAGGGGGASQSRLVLGPFSIYPAFGYILPGAQQIINVDCVAELAVRSEEEIAIDLTGRDPQDHPAGIPYKLIAEGCQQAINVHDIGTIFEEHRIVKNLSVWQHSHQIESGGVFGEDENRFVFNNVLVGMRAKARFKITNTNKVPCDVLFSIKPISARGSGRFTDMFEIEPSRTQIPSHSHMYATVTFCPPSMQSFTAIFEAAIEGLTANQSKGRNLLFELHGEGNLPRISISKPSVRNKKGQPLILFRRNLIGRSQTLPLVITNEGNLPSKVDIDLADPDSCFQLTPTGSTQAVMAYEPDSDGKKRPHAASVIINSGEQATFNAIFRPTSTQRSQAHIKLSVVNNQYEDSVVQMVGEGYEDDITLDNIHSVVKATDPEQQEGSMADDDVSAAKPNLINFGDCYVNEPRTLTFSMTNHSKTDSIRFVWPDHPQLKFSPTMGHIHSGRSKDFTVTFKAEAPSTLNEGEVLCKVTKITFDAGVSPGEWDDRLRTVKWVDVTPEPPAPATTSGTDSVTKPPTSPVPQPPVTPAAGGAGRPSKKKVIETEPEPTYTEVTESARNVELLVSASCDNCKYKCKTEIVHFKDTLMFQTRVYEFHISNKGNVQMDYNWQLIMENFASPGPRSVTFAPVEQSRPSTARPTTAATAAMAVRPSSAMDYRPDTPTSSIISDVAYTPYSIEPTSGTVLPGKKANFKVKFSPLDVQESEARLICSIPNLGEGKQGPTILLKGKSLMPYCHFELVDSDYITSARRNPELRGPGGAPPGTTLDPNTRVIEFDAVGVGVKTVRKFNIVNPTTMMYSFSWENNDEANPKKLPDFNLLHRDGEIRPGKKTEVIFEFTSSQLGVVESFMTFHLHEHNISVPFLLVGNTRDSNVCMDRSHLNYKSLLIGHEAVEIVHIQNSEDTSYSFAFDPSSCHSPGFANSLKVEPMQGVVPAKGSVPIKIYFTPNSEKEVNFNLVCEVKRKTLPLTLNIKAEGYSMNCLVLCEDVSGNRVELTSNGLNAINFGEVEINEKSIRNMYIVNSGKFNFDYTWELNERSNKKMVSITPAAGGVMCEERALCKLAFCPPVKTTLRGCELVLKISNGPKYDISILGEGIVPGVHVSFNKYDFGPCFIHRAGMPTHSVVLHITNRDKKENSVECLYAPTKHMHHNFEAKVIKAGQTEDVTFTFFPREAIRYKEVITFEINGLSRKSIDIHGQGTEMKVEVANPRDKIVKFGAMRIGQTVKRSIPIVNNSPAPITFHLGITPSSPLLQDKNVLRLTPTHDITLQPHGGTAKVDIVFSPKARIPPFTEEVMLECAGLFQPLFVVSGSCQGIEISLDSDSLPFGAVVQKSSSSRKLVMINTGDIGARFKWDRLRFQPDFSIQPIEGYISPGMEVPFEVMFHPQEVNQDIRYDNLKCQIEGSKPLRLTLTGMCVAVPPVREVLNFSTTVRHSEKKKVMVPNKTNMLWNLRPVIDGEFWTGPETFVVEPQQIKGYELKYKPLVMTSEGKKHTGSVFFPMPDGNGMLFNLTGTAEVPKPIDKIVTKEIPCKTSFTLMLTVDNWLKKPQRFRVKQEMMKPEKLDAGTTVKGLDYIDVPGNSKRDYKLNFYAHREGTSQMKVVFTNEKTGEYQFYEVQFKATRPGTISTINLSTPVRQSVPHTVMLENPLSYAVTFAVTSCNVPEMMMPNQMSVPAQSEGAFNLEYLPLKVGDTQGQLQFTCNDLGLYIYDLNLKATKAGPERALYFRTCLGTNTIQTARFLNFAKQKTDYTCKVDNNDFHVEKNVAAAPGSNAGTEVAIDVQFEPSRIGESRGTLTVSSGSGGDYTFPLFGTCLAPKPQGPFTVKAGTNTNITFRNVFSHPTPFTFQVDNPLFHVAKQGETVRSRKDHRIVVGFDGNDSGTSKAAVMGKLVVSCAKSAGGATNAQWVYYLKGVTPDGR